jgi:hypothetical protein
VTEGDAGFHKPARTAPFPDAVVANVETLLSAAARLFSARDTSLSSTSLFLPHSVSASGEPAVGQSAAGSHRGRRRVS